jgi:hypothetical protein
MNQCSGEDMMRSLLTSGVLLVFAIGTLSHVQAVSCGTAQEASVDASRHKELIEKFIAAYNAFDVESMVALLSPDIRFENYSGNNLTVSTVGIDEFRKLAEQSKSLFAEREQRISSVTFSRDSAIVSIEYRGRLAADLPGGPRAGTILRLRGVSEYSFHGDRITKIVDRS